MFTPLMPVLVAQVIPDQSLGVEQSIVNQDVTVRGLVGDRIDGGASRGSNLFHSFSEFNVNDGQRVYFGNPAGINHIFSRVTGTNPSNISGTLGVDGAANLYLLNPNGILFGENANLDLEGSFLATSATEFVFEDDQRFSASMPTAPSLLTVRVPLGLQFAADPGPISVDRSFLFVQPRTTLALAGGPLTFDGVFLDATEGRVDVGSVGADNFVSILPQEDGWQLNYDDVQQFDDIQLESETFIRASGNPGGEIRLHGQDIALLDGSQVFSQTFNEETGEPLLIRARTLNLEPDAFVSTVALGSGQAGPITVMAETLTLNAASITSNSGTGDAGNLTIEATREVELLDGSILSASTLGSGQSGRLRIETDTLRVADQSIIDVGTGLGQSGALRIQASSLVSLSDASTLSGLSFSGQGRNIRITTGQLRLTGGSQITAGTSGAGTAGDIIINASDSIVLAGASDGRSSNGDIVATVPQQSGILTSTISSGSAGDIRLSTSQLTLKDGGLISSDSFRISTPGSLSSFTPGPAGTISIVASDAVELTGGAAISPVFTFDSQISSNISGAEESGSIRILAPQLTLRDGATVSTGTSGMANAGRIELQGRSLTLSDRGQIQSNSTSQGNAGVIRLMLDDQLMLIDSDITTQSTESSGGKVVVNAGNIILRSDSDIRTEVNSGEGAGGQIFLRADAILLLDDSDIFAFSADGIGGTINIDALGFFGEDFTPDNSPPDLTILRALDDNNRVDISATGGLQTGTVLLPETQFIQNSLADLPDRLINTETLVSNSCVARNNRSGSTFIVTGNEGLPESPGGASITYYETDNVQSISREQTTRMIDREQLWQVGEPIVEAQGVYPLPNGQLILSQECQYGL